MQMKKKVEGTIASRVVSVAKHVVPEVKLRQTCAGDLT
jgi:hypothetical protein